VSPAVDKRDRQGEQVPNHSFHRTQLDCLDDFLLRYQGIVVEGGCAQTYQQEQTYSYPECRLRAEANSETTPVTEYASEKLSNQ
jgi:hypothetical protein